MIEKTKNLLEATIQQSLDLAKAANSAFRTHDDVAVALPGGMFGHVHKGRLVGFGLEPVGDVVSIRTVRSRTSWTATAVMSCGAGSPRLQAVLPQLLPRSPA